MRMSKDITMRLWPLDRSQRPGPARCGRPSALTAKVERFPSRELFQSLLSSKSDSSLGNKLQSNALHLCDGGHKKVQGA